MAAEQPINADAPAPQDANPRRRAPLAVKLAGGALALAIVFIVAAIVGGGSGGGGSSPNAAAPVGGGGDGGGGPAAQTASQLGYPAFATSNTTRVGGASPASDAAGVALATYPSSDATQRPAAVALVDAASWQDGIAAAVLMAAPLGPPNGVRGSALSGGPEGAPLLISEAGAVPEATAQALQALDPQGSHATGGAQAFAIGAAAVPAALRTRRIAGAGPAATAAAIAALRDRLFGGPPRHVVVAPVGKPGFAMPAAAWAARSGDPILFSGPSKLPPATAAALRRHSGSPVYVIGPPSAISSAVMRQIARIDGRARRVSGENPISNAIALARYADGDFGWDVNDPGHGFVVARSDSPLDAAAAAPLSASGTWGPLLLTDSADTLPAALHGYLLDVKPGYTTNPTRAFYNHVWVIGNQEAIDVKEQAEIDQLAQLVKIGGQQ